MIPNSLQKILLLSLFVFSIDCCVIPATGTAIISIDSSSLVPFRSALTLVSSHDNIPVTIDIIQHSPFLANLSQNTRKWEIQIREKLLMQTKQEVI